MEKRLRSSLRSSAEEFLAAAASESESKQVKSALKALICSITPSSDLCTSLPAALHLALSRSLDCFRNSLQSQAGDDGDRSSRSPPVKRVRRWEESSPSPSNDGAEELPVSQAETLARLRDIRRYACIAHICVSHPRKSFSPPDFLPCVRSLHDCLILFETDDELLLEVASLCEKWWKEKLPEREALISQSLPFLLSRSLTMNKKTYVHRVYAMRDAFLLFDFHDESIEDLKLLLLRCVITPLYLKTDEGRRFIAFMLTLNGKLLKEALALIKSQIPFGRKTVLEAYADILFRFWKHSEDSFRTETEDGSRSLANSIRRILRGFIDNRATDGVDKLLFRLAEPVLFRSLQVIHCCKFKCPSECTALAYRYVPLENPDVTREAKNELLEKQFFLLERLLADDSPDIRSVAVEGCCRVLYLFWEVIPSSTITKMLTKIIDDISHDASNDVKLSTLKGIAYLLGNPQASEVLKVLLPRLGFMFLDPFLSVRMHVCDLLLAAKTIRSFQFNKVVDLDILLSSLANDHPIVAQKIVSLLMPSYFPSKVTTKEACNRFIALVKRSPAAGARFCEFARLEGSSSKSLIELVKACFNLATSSSEDLTPGQIDGLFTASSNLCRDLSSDAACKATLCKFFSKETLKSLLSTISSVRAQNSILSIASFVYPDGLVDFHDNCMRLIKNCSSLTGKVEMQAEIRRVHRLMVSNGRSNDLFGALADILRMAASRISDKLELPKNEEKTTSKNSDLPLLAGSEDCAVAAAAAWQVKDLLAETETRTAMLTSPFLESVSSSLGTISRVFIEKSASWEQVDLLPVLAYTTLSLYRSLQDVDLTKVVDPPTGSSGEPRSSGSLRETLEGLLDSAETLFHGADSNRKGAEGSAPLTRSRRRQTLDASSTPTVPGGGEDDLRRGARLHRAPQVHSRRRHPPPDPPLPSPLAALRLHLPPPPHLHLPQCRRPLPFAKSSFTYAAKLLHVLLSAAAADQPLHQVPLLPYSSSLAHDLLDLAAAASLRLSTAPPHLPLWLRSLAAAELRQFAGDGDGGGGAPPAIVGLLRAAAALLRKGNPKVLAAVGAVLVEAMEVGLRAGDFDLVLGLVRFLSLEVAEAEGAPPCGFLNEAHKLVGQALADAEEGEEQGRRRLEAAEELLRSLCGGVPSHFPV
ncbi:unnamed protein product [Spirodela intermedia]|uniref:Uncharacterized protein n=1 Tax=Spirodela intermedia TaxID=51605 RepID=A0A7I8J0P5_SPIIN|nr:unnamed protein product [Spirodela intermedia]CAA6662981.1 unnamed protein product [Spirodela intermedia]